MSDDMADKKTPKRQNRHKTRQLSSLDYSLAGIVSGCVTRAVSQPLDVLKIRFQLQVEPVGRSRIRKWLTSTWQRVSHNRMSEDLFRQHTRLPDQLHHPIRSNKMLTDRFHLHAQFDQFDYDMVRAERGKYRGMRQALRLIIAEEGWTALWKGHVPAQSLSIVYGCCQFMSYEKLKSMFVDQLTKETVTEHEKMIDFICGSLSGTIATVAALPLDVTRTRLVAQGKHKAYRNMRHAVENMYKREGLSSFYRGFVPCVVQVAPFTGFQFMFYKLTVRLWDRLIRHKDVDSVKYRTRHNTKPLESLVCGAFAGTAAKSAVYPLDMIKKRMQIRGFERARASFGRVPQYTGLVDCIRTIVRQEGMTGLYKGLVPSLYKAAVVSGVGFFIYEQSCTAINKWHLWEEDGEWRKM